MLTRSLVHICQQTFTLDGHIDLNVSISNLCEDDAEDQFLLRKGVCWQLGIITYSYHPDVILKGEDSSMLAAATQVPLVRVRLLDSHA